MQTIEVADTLKSLFEGSKAQTPQTATWDEFLYGMYAVYLHSIKGKTVDEIKQIIPNFDSVNAKVLQE